MPLDDKDCQILTQQIQHIKEAVDDIKARIDAQYVTKAEFWPVKVVVYNAVGASGLILLAYLMRNLMGIGAR